MNSHGTSTNDKNSTTRPPGGPRRLSAKAIWENVRDKDPTRYPNEVTRCEAGHALGPYVVARAVLDMSGTSLEDAWMRCGISERFISSGKGRWCAKNATALITFANAAAEKKGRHERFSPQVFSKLFYSVEELEQACLL